jgi:murein DD-endopeptidase MepM/ murein hydrolase activator NlpD
MNLNLAAPLSVMLATEGWNMKRAGRDYHGGLDLRAPVGTPVRAASSGVVVKAGPYSDTPGLTVELDHGDGMLTRYLHLSRLDAQTGQRVSKGQQIGLSGFATSPHVHFDAWVATPKLYEYVQRFGSPTTGFTVTQNFGGKLWVKVPAEPLAPMSYQDDVVAAAKAANVKLYSPLSRNALLILLAMGLTGYLVYRRFSAPSAQPSLTA